MQLRPSVSLVFGLALLVSASAQDRLIHAQEERIEFKDGSAVAGEQVILQSSSGAVDEAALEGVTFEWTLSLGDGEQAAIEGNLSGPELIFTLQPMTVYEGSFARTSADGGKTTMQFAFISKGDGVAIDNSSIQILATEVVSPTPMPPNAGSDDQEDDNSVIVDPQVEADNPDDRMSQRLDLAMQWAERITQLRKFDQLVIPVSFFESQLGTSERGLVKRTRRPLLAARLLFEKMKKAAEGIPPEMDELAATVVWQAQKQEFLADLDEKNGETERARKEWESFLDRWEQRVMANDADRFREALIQAPMIVAGVLLEFERVHIEAALTSGGPSGSTIRTSSGSSPDRGRSRAALRHKRIMDRIYRRYERR